MSFYRAFEGNPANRDDKRGRIISGMPSTDTPLRPGDTWVATWTPNLFIGSLTAVDPANNLFEVTQAAPPGAVPAYHTRAISYPWNGTNGYTETYTDTPISLDDLLAAKQRELTDYTGRVLSANAQSSQVANWVIVLDDIQRTWIASVINFLHDRMKDIVIDSDPKSYWARDVPLVIVNKNTDERDRPNVTEAQWGTVIKDIGLHDFATVDANELVIADINTAYGDGSGAPGGPEWTSLANINVQDPVYGWPPVYETNVNSTNFNGGGG